MKIALIGAGTVIYQDEGVGVFATKYIENNYTFNQDITIVDGGVLGFQLMTYYQEFDKVIILDTITMDDKVGSIYNLPSEELLGLGSYKQTAHEVEIVEMLEICSLLEKMAIVSIIGIVPKDIETVGVGLTLIVVIAVLVQPAADTPVTVYVFVVVGEKTVLFVFDNGI